MTTRSSSARARSASGHPIFVAGPQVGYFFPEVFLEYDLHGGGHRRPRVALPGAAVRRDRPRARTSPGARPPSSTDIVDTFVESLCGPDDLHYLYKGQCRAMTTFDAGILRGAPGQPDTKSSSTRPCTGRSPATRRVKGVRVALAQQRSTRGREAVNLVPFMELNENVPTSPQTFVRTMSKVELAFNWHYADSEHIAYFSSARLPLRAPGTDPQLPTLGNGEFDWRGFAPAAAHAAGDRPAGRLPRQLEQPAGARLRRRRRQLVVRLGPARRSCSPPGSRSGRS